MLALRKGLNIRYQPIILAFSFLFGYSVFQYGGDIIGYKETFEEVVSYSWYDYGYLVTHSLDPERTIHYSPNSVTQKPDIFALTSMFLVSRVTDNPRWFWGLISLIYTWFILLVFREVKQQFNFAGHRKLHLMFIVALAAVIPFYVGVTGVRFWPALFLFVLFVLKYTRTGKSKFVFLSALSILIHYAYFVPVGIFVLYHLFPVKRMGARVLVFGSIAFFFLSTTTGIFNFLQEASTIFEETTIKSSVESYTNQEIYEQRIQKGEQANWYVALWRGGIHYFLLFATLIEFLGLVRWRDTAFTRKLYPLLIIFFCLTLVTFNLGSLGRFKNIFYLLALSRYVVLFAYNFDKRYFKTLSYVLAPLLAINIVISMRAGFYFVDPLLIISNPVILFLTSSSESLSEFIVGH